jgi:carboxymethylenebutenolidase
MCSEIDALPPDLPARLVLASSEALREPELMSLRSEDGTRFAASFAESPAPRGPLVVVLPDVRGLYRFYEELALRFAQAGHHAIVVDIYGRTAGAERRGEEFDWQTHMQRVRPEQVQADVAAAIAEVTRRTGETRAVMLGFCFGGSQSYLASMNPELGLAGVVAFYGGLDGTRRGLFPYLPDVTDQMKGPILGLFGGDDPGIPAEMVAHFEAGLTRLGVQHEIVVYPGAPHSFFDRSFGEHAEACDDAWGKVIDFLNNGVSAGPRAAT